MDDLKNPKEKYVQEYEVEFLAEVLEETKGLYGALAVVVNFLL